MAEDGCTNDCKARERKEESTAFRRNQRSVEDEAVCHGGHAPCIICLFDSQPDLTLLNYNVPTHCDGADAHTSAAANNKGNS